MGIYRKLNSPNWHYSFKLPGRQQVRGSTGYSDRKLAQKKFDILKAEAQQRRDFGDPVKWTVGQIIEWTWKNFWSQKPNANKERLLLALRPFLKAFGSKVAADISAQELRDYRIERQLKVKMSTTNRELTYARFAFNRAIEEKLLSENPLTTVKRVSEKRFKRDRSATQEEQAYLFDRSKGQLHKIIRFALATGMRQGEIRQMKKHHIDLINKEIRVESWKGGELSRRFVPIYPDALEILAEIKHPFENVFHNGRGHEIPRHGLIHSGWQRLTKLLGIDSLTFHDLRHTFATELWRKTRDIVMVHKILGHEKIDTTMTYLNLKKTDLQQNYLSHSTLTKSQNVEIAVSA